MDELPRLYFRTRENGAAVFRVETATRDGRLGLRQIAVVNARSGEVKPQGGPLAPEDAAAIGAWLAERRAELAARGLEDARDCVERIGRVAHWAQSKASPAELDEITDALMLAMHDLRGVLLRRKAERIEAARAAGHRADEPDDEA
ncbi:hypothetical protein DLJ49_07080 [Rhodovulum sp. 12E13]|uniref:hypothetical protein n=1 Tax=Rhodovulum sp. 12E13 TaxID=2203891 RepID=UPI000E12599C|nr:hypothetical protein [Rhodovulum sp. 12E13]RDC73328.1 hypothetical protein DLJ49_07080 [Rhodovulum sp. 12E13]